MINRKEYTTKIDKRVTPCSLDDLLFLIIGIETTATINNSNKIVKINNLIGIKTFPLIFESVVAAIRSVASIKLEPKMFPIPISALPILIADIVVTNSGILVPTEIINTPRRPSLIPNNSLSSSILATKTFAPNPIASAEIINCDIVINHDGNISFVSIFSEFFASKMLKIKNATKNNTNIIASTLPTRWSIATIVNKQIAKIKNNNLLFILSPEINDGLTKNDKPNTNVKLLIIEPRAVLTAIASCPENPEMIETEISGNVVAIATTVAPTMMEGIFAFFANHTDDSTSKSPPFKIKTNANITLINAMINNTKLVF